MSASWSLYFSGGPAHLAAGRHAGAGAYEVCHLVVDGSGEKTPEGDVLTTYSGTCTPGAA